MTKYESKMLKAIQNKINYLMNHLQRDLILLKEI